MSTGATIDLAPDARRARPYGLYAAWVLMACLYIAMAVYTSPTFRGSDQYWYVEDTRTLMQGQPAETHETFPYFQSVGADEFSESRPFVHNVPVLRAWAVASNIAGGDVDAGVLSVNILCGLLTALFTYLAVRVFASRAAGTVAAAFTMFVPVGFWVTSQAMAEPFSGTLVALAVWLALRYPGRLPQALAAVAAVALAAAGRIWAIAFLPMVALAMVMLDRERSLALRWGRAVLVGAAGLVAYVPLSAAFVNFMPPLDPMALLEVSRTNNMVMYYMLEPAARFDAAEFVRGIASNARAALIAQFSPVAQVFPITPAFPWADRLPVDLAALVALMGLVWKKPDRVRLYAMLLGVAAFAMHLGMAVLYLNHPRYIVVALAPLAIGAAAVVAPLWERASRGAVVRWGIGVVIVAVLAGSLAVDVKNARDYRADALAHERLRTETAALVTEVVPADARVVIDGRFGGHWPADFAVYPRQTLVLATDFPYDAATYQDLVEGFRADYLICDESSVLPELLEVQLLGSTDRYVVYRILDQVP